MRPVVGRWCAMDASDPIALARHRDAFDNLRPAMKTPAPLDDTSILFAHLPADGSSIGNGSLRDMLGWNETRYLAARQKLIDDGRVLTGKGRGGSVRRAVPAGLDGAGGNVTP